MPALRAVDRLEILILVDNVTDMLSTVKPSSESELSSFFRRGMRLIGGHCLCCAAHGFACLVTAWRNGKGHRVLFDTGPEPHVLLRNVERLDVDLATIEAIVLSHGHFDHMGGLVETLDAIRACNGGVDIPVYVHPGMFRTRAQQMPDGTMLVIEDVPDPATMRAHGAEVIETAREVALLDDMFHVSGEIARVTPFERGLPGHFARAGAGDAWEPDPLLLDERYLAIDVAGKGLVVLSACSHAGIVNVLTDVRATFPQAPIHAVAGGFHLSGANEAIIPQTVEAMAAFDIPVIAAAHCTGWRATTALAMRFGESVLDPCAVGKTYRF
ncbi:MAG: MBL fold metallo-hydrolase [bacterium]|nr:MBL fold metallo-hydrolase [bacterium]